MAKDSIEAHYDVADLETVILDALAADGKDIDNLTPDDLASVDEFHIRGREATRELVALAGMDGDQRVLDVGSGIGGSARYLAAEFRCHVTGIDLTKAYCDVARALSDRVGLGDKNKFHCGSALELPFDDASFDVVWTEHVQMNIADKSRFYGEIARVLKPASRLAFHDVFEGPEAPPHFPVPWAEEPAQSFLVAPDALAAVLQTARLEPIEWRDVSDLAREWCAHSLAAAARESQPRTSIRLLMRDTAAAKLTNLHRNLEERRVVVLQAVLQKTD